MNNKTSKQRANEMGINVLNQLISMLKNGLPKCYKGNIGEFMLDLTMDLPWDDYGRNLAISEILKQPDYQKIEKQFKAKYPNTELFSNKTKEML